MARQKTEASVRGNSNGPVGNVSGVGNVMARTSWFTRIKNDWSKKKKITCVFLSVTIATGGTTAVLVLLGPEPPAEGQTNPHSTTEPSAPRPGSDVQPTTTPPPSGPDRAPNSSSDRDRPASSSSRTDTPGDGAADGDQEPTDSRTNDTNTRTPRLATTSDLSSGLPGTSVNFYGTGYDGCPDHGSRTVDVLWDGNGTDTTVPIEPDGRFGVRFTVPESAATGTHYLYGRCTDGGEWARTEFNVTPPLAVSTSPVRGKAGTSVQVRGTGYGGCPDYGNRAVNVTWDGTNVSGTAPIQADGTFTITFTVPATSPGDYYITGQCQDGGQWARAIFTVVP